jgi:hypothetical protein
LGGHTEESKRNFVIWDESIISKMWYNISKIEMREGDV